MEEKIYNEDKVLMEDISKTITRVKIILIDSNNDITLAFSDNVYHFVGGHVEDGESLDEAVIREVKEETGIVLKNKKYTPFYKITQIFKDYPQKNNTNCYEYYYYEVRTDELPNLNNTNYTVNELEGSFELRKINLDDIENEIKSTLSWGERNNKIGLTMLEALEVYKRKIHK